MEGAAKAYGSYQVFEGIDLNFGAREIVSVVGPSGCGKTTLLRCLNGLTRLTRGTVSIHGERVTHPPDGVAMVFQHFGLFPWKTVYDNVSYGLKVRGRPSSEIAEIVQPFIDLVGLTGFEKHYPYQLSGGMQCAGQTAGSHLTPRLGVVSCLWLPAGRCPQRSRPSLECRCLTLCRESVLAH